MAVEESKRMVAMGWLDGSAVQMLSTADGTTVSTVTRRIGGTRKDVDAPTIVHRYNHAMQAVDWHDQLRVKQKKGRASQSYIFGRACRIPLE